MTIDKILKNRIDKLKIEGKKIYRTTLHDLHEYGITETKFINEYIKEGMSICQESTPIQYHS